MKLAFDYNNMMGYSIGEHGIKKSIIDDGKAAHKAAYDEVIGNSGKGWQEWTETPLIDKTEIDELNDFGKSIREKASSFVVLGIGGSALGPICVFNALLHLHHNELPEKMRKAPKIYVEDNIDPERMSALLDVIDLKTTYFNIITKSGETSETLSQFIILYNAMKKAVGERRLKNISLRRRLSARAHFIRSHKKKGLGFSVFPQEWAVGFPCYLTSDLFRLPLWELTSKRCWAVLRKCVKRASARIFTEIRRL